MLYVAKFTRVDWPLERVLLLLLLLSYLKAVFCQIAEKRM